MIVASAEPGAATVAAPALTRWEYLTAPVVAAGFEDAAGVENYTAVLNKYGGQGWELVGVAGFPGKSVEGWVAVLFLKRPFGSTNR